MRSSPSATPSATEIPTPIETPTNAPVAGPPEGWSDPIRIDERLPPSHEAYRASLAMLVDDLGYVHVAQSLSDGIHYLTNESGVWASRRVSAAASSGWDGQPSIAYDPSYGTVSIAYTRWTTYEPCVLGGDCEPRFDLDGIYYATENVMGSWNEPFELIPEMAQPSMLANDLKTYVAFSHEPDADSSVFYYVSSDGSADGSPVTVEIAERARNPSLRLAADGTPRLVFLDNHSNGFRYATGASIVGPFEIARGPAPDDYTPFQFSLGPRDEPIIAFGMSGIDVVTASSDGWTEPRTLLPQAVLGGFDVDRTGGVHVVSQPEFGDPERNPTGIWYATDRNGEPTPQQLKHSPGHSDTDGVRLPAALDVDSTGRPLVVFNWLDEPAGLWYTAGPEP